MREADRVGGKKGKKSAHAGGLVGAQTGTGTVAKLGKSAAGVPYGPGFRMSLDSLMVTQPFFALDYPQSVGSDALPGPHLLGVDKVHAMRWKNEPPPLQ